MEKRSELSILSGAVAAKQRRPRVEIVRAAVDVFAQRGVKATRVEDILVAAGVARRTFYKHFESKHGVLGAVYEIFAEELIGGITAATAAGNDLFEAMELALGAYLEVHVTHPVIVRVLIEEAIRSDSALAPLRRSFRKQVLGALDGVIVATTGQRLDPFLSIALISGLEGLSLELVSEAPTPERVERAKRAILALIKLVLANGDDLPKAPASPA